GHTAFFSDHLGKSACSRLGQQEDGVIKVGLACSVRARQHVDLAQVQAQTAHGPVSSYMNFTYSHGCILNETRHIVTNTTSKGQSFFAVFLLLSAAIFSVQYPHV